jgi:hypothetical protein
MKNRWLVATALLCVACKNDQPPSKEAAPTATAPEPEAKIKSVFTAEPAGTAAPPGQAPPPTGVFAPGEADKAHPKGAPATIEVIDKGAEPRVTLKTPLEPGYGQTVKLLIGLRMGGGVLPNVVYTLKVASPKKDDDDEVLPGEPTSLVATITDAALAEQQPGQIPEQLRKLITEVKGSRIETSVLPNGALQGVKVTYGEDLKEQGVRAFVDSIGDVMGYFFSPYPDEPIGKGGYWISHDRLSIQSLDLVRYRVTKVEELKGDEMLLSVQLRHYLAGGDISALVGKDQPGIVAGGFDSAGQAQLARKTGSLFPLTGEMRTPFTIVITMENNPQAQAQPVQFDVQARWLPAEASDKEAEPPKGGTPKAPTKGE